MTNSFSDNHIKPKSFIVVECGQSPTHPPAHAPSQLRSDVTGQPTLTPRNASKTSGAAHQPASLDDPTSQHGTSSATTSSHGQFVGSSESSRTGRKLTTATATAADHASTAHVADATTAAKTRRRGQDRTGSRVYCGGGRTDEPNRTIQRTFA